MGSAPLRLAGRTALSRLEVGIVCHIASPELAEISQRDHPIAVSVEDLEAVLLHRRANVDLVACQGLESDRGLGQHSSTSPLLLSMALRPLASP